jgi:hypothetical protein
LWREHNILADKKKNNSKVKKPLVKNPIPAEPCEKKVAVG